MQGGTLITVGENEVRRCTNPTQNAKMVAATRAAEVLVKADLAGCTVISTLQPCEMCRSAIRIAGIDRIIFAAREENVPKKHSAFAHLRISDRCNVEFEYCGGAGEATVLHLYEQGDQFSDAAGARRLSEAIELFSPK
jgi:tRNA(adenine34) deaminase